MDTVSNIEPSVEYINKLKKKYGVTFTGNKIQIVFDMWNLRKHTMDMTDIKQIYPLLNPKHKAEAIKIININATIPVDFNFQNTWEPLPKPLSDMSRVELIRNLGNFRNAWEKLTTKNTDLSNERLHSETDKSLRDLLKPFYGNMFKQIAISYLMNY
jgi:hypothetical protein